MAAVDGNRQDGENPSLLAFNKEREERARYHDFHARANRIYRLAETMGKDTLQRVMTVYDELITVLSEDKLPVFSTSSISGRRPGEVANPNGGHATERGTWKRAKGAGEKRGAKKGVTRARKGITKKRTMGKDAVKKVNRDGTIVRQEKKTVSRDRRLDISTLTHGSIPPRA